MWWLHKSEKPSRQEGIVVIFSGIAAVAGILFGYDTGVISGAILYVRDYFALTPWLEGIVVGSILLGALIGSALSGRGADYLGRRTLLIITSLIFIVGTLGSAIAWSIPSLIISRFIVGIAIGVASYTAPLYISEVSPSNQRGALVSLNQLAITVGIVLSYISDIYFAKHGGQWRMMFGTGVIPAFILFVGMLFVPDSPRWLVYKARFSEARAVLQRIRGQQFVDDELDEIVKSIHSKSSWRLLFQDWLRPAVFISLGLAFFQQVTGVNTIIYYSSTIFEMAGFHDAVAAILATLGVGIVNVLATIVSLFLIDRWGRRPLLFLGLSGMTVGLIGVGVAFYSGIDVSWIKWIALFGMILYIACFAISLGPIVWLVIAEIYPLEVRGLGSSIAASANWGFNMIVAVTFLSLIQKFGPSNTFFLYAFLCVMGLWFTYRYVPETKGVHLEEIEANLKSGVKGRHLGRVNR